jgi:ureidoacrylate peracid hydrolase
MRSIFIFCLAAVLSFVMFSFAVVCAANLTPADYAKGPKVLTTLEEQINPEHTALIVIDMQNDFFYGPGKLSFPPGTTDRRETIITPMNAFIDKCRKMGVPVIYTFTIHAGDLDLPPYKAPKIRKKILPVCVKGSKGGEFPEKLNKPLPNEPVVTKHGYDAFMDHNLHTLLQNRGIKTLIFSGIDTGICVSSTLRHAFHLGYYVVLAEDISAATVPERHNVEAKTIEEVFGFVTSTPGIMQIWEKTK